MMSRTSPLIAVVNDDQAYIDFVRELLADEGYETIACVGEHAAHAMVRREKPDLIILDMRLENPDAGWQILQLIRLDPATKDIPVLMCSADTKFLKEKEQQLRAQRCDILEKPFDLEMLLEKVRAAVGPAHQA